MAYTVVKFGPGTIQVGDVGTPVDFSCQLINAIIEWDKDKDDDTTTLCGDVVPGSMTYTATLTGTLFQDVGLATGILQFSWDHKGETVPFEFTPNTEVGTTATGNLIIDPVSFGSDEPKANMQSDFTWDIVGEPALGPALPLTAAEGSATEPEGSETAA